MSHGMVETIGSNATALLSANSMRCKWTTLNPTASTAGSRTMELGWDRTTMLNPQRGIKPATTDSAPLVVATACKLKWTPEPTTWCHGLSVWVVHAHRPIRERAAPPSPLPRAWRDAVALELANPHRPEQASTRCGLHGLQQGAPFAGPRRFFRGHQRRPHPRRVPGNVLLAP